MRKLTAGLFASLLWATTAFAGGPKYELGVAGLACPYCAYGLEKQFNEMEGVESIEFDLKQSRAVVQMAQGQSLSEARAREAVEDAGFTLGSFGRIKATASPNDE
ncbi:MAG: heavy-metal-associated domain-containing protein [Gammaproteobacteria bacterium]